jgi:hypothetical protein
MRDSILTARVGSHRYSVCGRQLSAIRWTASKINGGAMQEMGSAIVAAVVSGSVFATILGAVLLRRATRIQEEIKSRFGELTEVFRSKRTWQERSLSELLGPAYMQLDRTFRAFSRWTEKNLFLEAKVIREGNVAVRDLLLKNAHLIPPDLLDDAGRLVEHYDRWLEEFERTRLAENPDLGTTFTFVGPKGYPFPSDSDARFRQRFKDVWAHLYGEAV